MSLLDLDNNLDENVFNLYVNAYINRIKNRNFNLPNLLYEYDGVLGEYDNVDDLVVVSQIQYRVMGHEYIRVAHYHLISIYHPNYRKQQYGDPRGKPYHCDYYAGSPVTLKLIEKYILNKN